MRTSSPDNVDLRKVVLDVEELILALSSSMCPGRAVVAYMLMTVVMQTLSVPATGYARTLKLMLTRARQRNILPARSHPGGLAEGPDSGLPHLPRPLNIQGLCRPISSPSLIRSISNPWSPTVVIIPYII
jgi:hypothetical protein